ncbi:hypothetical protein [Streptomyces sp. IBSBF 2806]|uniref:hypothetical protein n=1 Tax=Streptomyces sp. IBSBF 2806 TaxID=2903529 RepID=UPI002FDC6F3A
MSGTSAPGAVNGRDAGPGPESARKGRRPAFPAEFHARGGLGHGVPSRATITDFGPLAVRHGRVPADGPRRPRHRVRCPSDVPLRQR